MDRNLDYVILPSNKRLCLKVMRITFNILIKYILLFCILSSQDLDDLSYGSINTLDIATWNIEWFPKNDQITVDNVIQVISQLDLDIIAIQEVDDIASFDQMLALLPSYLGYYESDWFAGLAFIFNNQTISINNIYEIYTTSSYWSPFPRSPMIMDFEYRGENYFIINNHFKCCGDGILDLNDNSDEENRRHIAINLLKEYIENNLNESNVILLGDLNDDIAEVAPNNIFQNVLNDSLNYRFADLYIASGDVNDWSFPNWPSHLDHILISSGLFDRIIPHFTSTIKIDNYLSGGWNEYDLNISDHRPVAIKILPEISLRFDINNDSEISFLDLEILILDVLNDDTYQIEFDFNFDSKVNLMDILKLKEIILDN